MAKKKYVLISLVTRKKLTKEPYGREILTLFYDRYPLLAPQFANFYEPINNPVNSVEDALKYWEGDPFLYRRKTSVVGEGNVGSDFINVDCVKFEYNWSTQIDWFMLFSDLVKITDSYFGYIHIFTEKEIEPAAVGSAIFGFLRGVVGWHLQKGIPQLGWAHYFGEEYVKEINVPLLKKNGFNVEKFREGYIFHITDKLSDVIDNYDYFDERRKLLKSLFRPELFQKYERFG